MTYDEGTCTAASLAGLRTGHLLRSITVTQEATPEGELGDRYREVAECDRCRNRFARHIALDGLAPKIGAWQELENETEEGKR